MRHKWLLIIMVALTFTLTLGVTYSFLTNVVTVEVANQRVASFIFNAQKLDHVELPLVELDPTEVERYFFEVTNNDTLRVSETTINYQITIKTYHFMPLVIKLYKVNDNNRLLLTCNETYSRNSNNELVCNSEVQEMAYGSLINDQYKLEVSFEEGYNSGIYADLVDYINLEITSWQK